MGDIKYLRDKTVIDLIKSRIFIKKIGINVNVDSPESSWISLFPKMYSDYLAFDNFLLKEECNTKKYTYGTDACGHSMRGRENYVRKIFPYFEYNYLMDDGYYQKFSITPNTKLENGFSFEENIKNIPEVIKLPLEKIKEEAPSILELTVHLISNYFDFIQNIDFEIGTDQSIINYLAQMHPKADSEIYLMLDIHTFSSFEKAKNFAKNNYPSTITIEKDIYIVEILKE